MAKRKSRTTGPTDEPQFEGTYIFLIKNTPLGSMDPKKWQKGAEQVNQAIRDLPGKCTFYQTTGQAYDGVSVVTDVSLADALEISRLINSFGTVVGTMMSGVKAMDK